MTASTPVSRLLDLVGELDPETLARLRDAADAALAGHPPARPRPRRTPGPCAARVFTVPPDLKHLDVNQLAVLTMGFENWASASADPRIAHSRRRMLLVYQLLRFTGAPGRGAGAGRPVRLRFRPGRRGLPGLGRG